MQLLRYRPIRQGDLLAGCKPIGRLGAVVVTKYVTIQVKPQGAPIYIDGKEAERIGLVNFLEGIGIDVDPNMVSHPRESSYVRMDDWDEEAEKWFKRKAEAAGG